MHKNDIIVAVYQNIRIDTYCKKINSNDWEDLKAELISQLMKMSEQKLLIAFNHGFLEYLCFKIIKRINYGGIKSAALFYKKIVFINEDEIPEIASNDDHDPENSQKVWEIVEKEHYYQKTLFKDYYQNGLNYRQISEKYGINLKSIYYAVNQLRKKIKNKLNE